jgi:hypothetical protein
LSSSSLPQTLCNRDGRVILGLRVHIAAPNEALRVPAAVILIVHAPPNCQRARRVPSAIPLDHNENIAVLEVIFAGVLRFAESVDPGPPNQAAAL